MQNLYLKHELLTRIEQTHDFLKKALRLAEKDDVSTLPQGVRIPKHRSLPISVALKSAGGSGQKTVVALIESGVQPGIFVENFKIKH